MSKGWIKLHRKVQDTPQWIKKPFGKGRAWVDLLMLANHAPGFIEVRGVRLPINRGEIGWSQPELAKRFGWSKGKVKRFLNDLETDKQIVLQNNNVTTVIIIINYEKYQGSDTTDSTANEPQMVLQTVSQTVPQTDPNNKNKEVKKNKETEAFNEFWDLYPKRKGRKVGKTVTMQIFSKIPAEEYINVITATRNYATSDVATGGYAKDPERFLKKDFWRDWLEVAVNESDQPLVRDTNADREDM